MLFFCCFFFFFFFKQKTAYEIMPSLVGSEMCIRDSFYISCCSCCNLFLVFFSNLSRCSSISVLHNPAYSTTVHGWYCHSIVYVPLALLNPPSKCLVPYS